MVPGISTTTSSLLKRTASWTERVRATLPVTVDFAPGGLKMSMLDEADALRRWDDSVFGRPSAKT